MVDSALEILKAILLALVALSLLSTLLSHVFTWYYFASYDRRFPTKGHAPPVSIIKPTKGIDQSALGNFRGFCEQDYPTTTRSFSASRGIPILPSRDSEGHAGVPDVDVRMSSAIRKTRDRWEGEEHDRRYGAVRTT